MIKGIGVDIVHLPRVFNLIDKYATKTKTLQGIARKVMCFKEQEQFKTLMNKWDDGPNEQQRWVRYMSGIWATKEAAYKGLSSYIPTHEMIPAQTIYTQFLYKSNNLITGEPRVDIMEQSSQQYQLFQDKYLKGNKIMLSISHDGDYLVAYTTIVSSPGNV